MSKARSHIGTTLAALEGLTYAGPPALQTAQSALDLAIGEVWFQMPPDVRVELGSAVSSMTRVGYSDPSGERELREAYLEHLGLSVPGRVPAACGVLITAGGKEALWLAVSLALEVDDPGCVMIPSPGWAPYDVWVRAAGYSSLRYDPVAFARSPEILDAAVRRAEVRPGLLVLNYPNNPTGVAVTQSQLNELVECAAGHGIRVISDEVYRAFTPDCASAALAPCFDPARDVVVDSCSKWLGAAGLRVGFLISGPEVLQPLVRFRATYASCTSIAAQRLAAALLRSDVARTWLKAVRAEIESTRTETVNELEALDITVASHGGLYIWAHNRRRMDAQKAAPDESALRARFTDGAEFGRADRIRICVAREGLEPQHAALAVRTTLEDYCNV